MPKEPPTHRLSKAYLLGFSDKPWKKIPSAPGPSESDSMTQLLTTPGGLTEWFASDGRRNSIAKAGKRQRDIIDNSQALSEKPKGKKGDDKGDKPKKDEDGESEEWTKSDDKKLMDWKSENPSGPWAEIGKELDKPVKACQERFKAIKPKDWKPNLEKVQGKKGGNDNQKQDKTDKKQNKQKKGETSAVDPSNQWGNDTNIGWDTTAGGDGGSGGNTAWDLPNIFEDSKDSQKSGSDKGNGNSGANEPAWGNTNGGDNTVGNAAWDNNNNDGSGGWNISSSDKGDQGALNTWDNNPPGNNEPAPTTWGDQGTAKPSRKDSSKKGSKNHHTSKPHSNHHHKSHSKQPSVVGSHGVELKPDDTFSHDDLRLMARILQQDASMIWQRLSWRFGDKTGRHNIDPDLFEKKITGRLKGKESSKGGQKKK